VCIPPPRCGVLPAHQLINGGPNRFFGRVSEDPRELRVGAQYAVFHIEKNYALRRLLKQLIELRFLCVSCSPLRRRSASACLRSVMSMTAPTNFKRPDSSVGRATYDSQVFDGTAGHQQPMLKIELLSLARKIVPSIAAGLICRPGVCVALSAQRWTSSRGSNSNIRNVSCDPVF